jgi:hypothetical protein
MIGSMFTGSDFVLDALREESLSPQSFVPRVIFCPGFEKNEG